MIAYQNAKLLMVKGLIEFCDENPDIVALVAAFQTAFTALKGKVTEIEDNEQLNSLSISGITTDKKIFKNKVCQITADLAGMIYAYAVDISNNTLKQEVNLSISKLKRKSESELVLVCRMVHRRGTENINALKAYGVTPEIMTDLQEAIADFETALPKPRTAIGKRKTRKEILRQYFKEMDEILRERMDNLMGTFRTSHPQFYEAYFNLRQVPDPSTTATQLKGAITDSATGKPIKSAAITIVELAKTAKTNLSGEYAFKPIEHGKFTVKVTAEGYQPFEAEEIEIKMGNIKHFDVRLSVT